MSRRLTGVLVAMVFLLSVAGALWAQHAVRTGEATCEKEADRCTTTCSMLINHYNRKFGAIKAHEGDKQCWETCWARMGESSEGSAADMKALWMEKMAENMHVNQCSQACWRKFHEESGAVTVGGWRSRPRTVVCTP